MKTGTWYAHGKLLLTGEYLVMHGAKALAVPLKIGQSMTVKPVQSQSLQWHALKPDGLWFDTRMSFPGFNVAATTDPELSNKLVDILSAAANLNPGLLNEKAGFEVETKLDFNTEFGFGSSSTMISNMAEWAEVDPYKLLQLTFGGSGYDIACARCNGPIFYKLKDEHPEVHDVGFSPLFANSIFFVYLGNKQRSSKAITEFKKSAKFSPSDILRVSQISEEIARVKTLRDFEQLVSEHESLIASIIKKPKVKPTYFADLDGCAKSLGAWGGDFILLTSERSKPEMKAYLEEKGFTVFFGYNDLVLD